jgi:hypothetical protein
MMVRSCRWHQILQRTYKRQCAWLCSVSPCMTACPLPFFLRTAIQRWPLVSLISLHVSGVEFRQKNIVSSLGLAYPLRLPPLRLLPHIGLVLGICSRSSFGQSGIFLSLISNSQSFRTIINHCLFEPRVFQSLFGSDPLLWIINKNLPQ